ncbi:MAG: PDZ domain-containing protein [Candidatus Brocadiia bacterium]
MHFKLSLPVLLCAFLAAPAQAQSEAPGFLGVAISEPARMDDASALMYFGAPNAQAFLQAWRLRAEDRGALVINVLPGRAADQCGIIPGDLIVTVNGVEIATASQFQRLVAAMHADAEVTLDLLRAGREKKLIVRLGARPREYPLAFLETPEAEAPKAAPPEGTALLVTPEEAAKALGGDFAPEPSTDPDYDAAVKLYRESPVANAEGLLLAGPIPLGPGDSLGARVGDEILRLGGKPVATPMGFADAILKHKAALDLPVALGLRGALAGTEKPRTALIENERDADCAAAAPFFTDEDRIYFWLLDFFPPDSAKNLEEQKALSPQTRDGVRFPFPAVVVTAPVKLHYDGFDPATAQPQGRREVPCAPGNILVRTQWMRPDANRREDALLFIREGRRTLVMGANWDPPVERRCDWCEPARLQARQLLECVVAARSLRLPKLAEDAAAFLAAACPGSKEAAALEAHDRPIQLAAWHARLRAEAAAGDVRSAVEAARAMLGKDPQGRYGREAKRFMECVNSAVEARIARAQKLLDAGDAAGARRETAPAAQAVPEDARLAAVLGRCDDVDTLKSGRRALEAGELRRARLMAEGVIARHADGAGEKPARQLLDDVRSSAESRTGRANRLLDAGDAASAREVLAPVLEAFPDDPAALAAWNRSRPSPK